MLDTRDLEKRWIKYKIKSYIPHIVIFISVLIIIVVTTFFIASPQKQAIEQTAVNMPVKKNLPQTISEKSVPDKQDIPKLSERNTNAQVLIQEPTNMYKEHKVRLSPSMDFMEDMQNIDQPYYKTFHTTEQPKQAHHKKRTQVTQQTPIVEDVINVDVDKKSQNEKINLQKQKPQPIHITIKREETNHDLLEIKQRFKNNHNPALSLFIAKKYYELGDYAQSYNYALITNGINNDIEDSWLVFAKSLVKLNKKDMAIKTLNEYIKYSHSDNAKMLLHNIQSGHFK